MKTKKKQIIDLLSELFQEKSEVLMVEGVDEALVSEENTVSFKDYLKRTADERLQTLAREVQKQYVPPKGILAVILKTLQYARFDATDVTKAQDVWYMVVCSVAAYLGDLIRKASGAEAPADVMAELKAVFSCASDDVTIKSFPYRLSGERKGGTGTYLSLGACGTNDTILVTGYGTKRGRMYHLCGGNEYILISAKEAAPYVLCGQIRKLIEAEDDSAKLLFAYLESSIRQGVQKSVGDHKRVKVTGQGRRYDYESVCDFLSDGETQYVRDYTPETEPDGIYYISPVLSLPLALKKQIDIERLYRPFSAMDKPGYWVCQDDDRVILGRVLQLWFSEECVRKNAEQYQSTLGTHTARVWEDLKNHTDKALKCMATSRFNEYFTKVEIDSGVDIRDFDTKYFEDFKAVYDEFLKGWEGKGSVLRIRKLGRHHAAGLYFPTIDCLCVDWNHPESTMHELGHRYDYDHGELSRKLEFTDLRLEYSTLLKKSVADFKVELKGKFDLEYYLTPTEIFARCFEIYLSRIHGVENSVVKPDTGKAFAYPSGKRLEELIDTYYSELLKLPKSGNEAEALPVCAAGR